MYVKMRAYLTVSSIFIRIRPRRGAASPRCRSLRVWYVPHGTQSRRTRVIAMSHRAAAGRIVLLLNYCRGTAPAHAFESV